MLLCLDLLCHEEILIHNVLFVFNEVLNSISMIITMKVTFYDFIIKQKMWFSEFSEF